MFENDILSTLKEILVELKKLNKTEKDVFSEITDEGESISFAFKDITSIGYGSYGQTSDKVETYTSFILKSTGKVHSFIGEAENKFNRWFQQQKNKKVE